NVFVDILDSNDEVVQELLNQHAHEQGAYEFKIDQVKIENAGTYRLRAYSTDMHTNGEHGGHSGGDEPEHHNMKMVQFTVQ
ncbi:MAG: hypothetical protein AAFO94_19040, partial [Bacteroidota bacterium]